MNVIGHVVYRDQLLFLTGDDSRLQVVEKKKLNEVAQSGAKVEKRRMLAVDLTTLEVAEWYLCTGPVLRKMISQEWLPGKKIISEDFDY